MAAIRSVGQFVTDGDATNRSMAANYPAVVEPGDGFLAIIWQDSDGTIANLTGATGWTQTGANITSTSSSMFGKCFLRDTVATGSEDGTTQTFTCSAGASTIIYILGLSAVDWTNPVAVALALSTTAASSTAPSAPTLGSGATPAVGDLLITTYAGAKSAALSQTTPPAGMTEVGEQKSAWLGAWVDGQTLTAAGTTGAKACTANTSSAVMWRTASIALRQAAAVVAPEPGRALLAA